MKKNKSVQALKYAENNIENFDGFFIFRLSELVCCVALLLADPDKPHIFWKNIRGRGKTADLAMDDWLKEAKKEEK